MKGVSFQDKGVMVAGCVINIALTIFVEAHKATEIGAWGILIFVIVMMVPNKDEGL